MPGRNYYDGIATRVRKASLFRKSNVEKIIGRSVVTKVQQTANMHSLYPQSSMTTTDELAKVDVVQHRINVNTNQNDKSAFIQQFNMTSTVK
jgi:hypothetical protein